MLKTKILILGTLILMFIAGCSQSIENQIIGTWESVDKTDDCDDTMGTQISFYDDNTISGIDGFQNYKIEKTDNDEYDYAILSGGYEDVSRYRIKIDEKEVFHIVYEEEDIYDFDDGIACHMEKVSD